MRFAAAILPDELEVPQNILVRVLRIGPKSYHDQHMRSLCPIHELPEKKFGRRVDPLNILEIEQQGTALCAGRAPFLQCRDREMPPFRRTDCRGGCPRV